ncbi:hypothetical protein [Butyrivibrio sp. AE3004]|uniref:hypothetical protein n=1 Tax=Butyrivibrio sp. AE3004 TaxID=1506994 RepID=UPI00049418E4|nr:hypothetical protein [Butyrivibrio sp. AE3004]
MSYDLSSSMNRMTDLYLDKAGLSARQTGLNAGNYGTVSLGGGNRKDLMDKVTSSLSRGKELKGKFGKEFDEVYDSLQAMRTLDATMRQSYDMNHRDDYKNTNVKNAHSAMTFSKGSSRIMDMLTNQVNSEMDDKVNKAMKDGLDSLSG